MSYCPQCGNQLAPNTQVCPWCGAPQNHQTANPPPDANKEDRGGFLWGLLGFFVPIVGLILFLIWRKECPRTAKAVGIGALVGVIVAVVLLVVYIVFISVLVSYFSSGDSLGWMNQIGLT